MEENPTMDGERDEVEGEGADSDDDDEIEDESVPVRLRYNPEESDVDRDSSEKPTRSYTTAQRSALDDLQATTYDEADRVMRQTEKQRLRN